MLFYNRNFCFNESKERKALIDRLVRILNSDKSFEAYKPNENDEYYWAIHQNNDYWLTFFESKPQEFRLIYRYNRPGIGDREEVLAQLLNFLIGAEKVLEKN